MELLTGRAAFRAACDAARGQGATVGLVPTMGALHAGHRSLLARARGECEFVAISIFVNPLQFGEAADLAAYPRDLQADLGVAEADGAGVVFAPAVEEMYASGEPEVTVDPGPLGSVLEGASRPGHFRGVLTVVAKLLHLAGPCRAYFGEKDAQQLELVRRMVRDLDLPAEIVACPTVRDADGLALSSRNALLGAEERRAALALSRGLSAAAALLGAGEPRAALLRGAIEARVRAEPLATLDYAAVVDDATWTGVEEVLRPARALVAARVGAAGTRLIDNVRLDPPAVPRAAERAE